MNARTPLRRELLAHFAVLFGGAVFLAGAGLAFLLPVLDPTQSVLFIVALVLADLLVLFAFAMPGTIDWPFLPDGPLLGIDHAAHEHDRIVGPVAGAWMLVFTLPSYRRFPNDEEFKRELSTRDLYNFPRRSYWLRRLENHGRKERVSVDEYTIEHILPQNPDLSAEWQVELGPDWDHFAPVLRGARERIPEIETIGFSHYLRAPESFTPDSNFQLGFVPEVGGLFVS